MEEEIVLGLNRIQLANLLTTKFGFIEEQNDYDYIKTNLSEKKRSLAENDDSFKQIIPYLLIRHNEEYLLYIRTKKQSEKRLHEKFSLGIGGHINPIDTILSQDIIIEALTRELKEEIDIRISSDIKFLGLINDDISDVGKVHLGLAFLAEAKSKNFEVIETEKMKCQWVSEEYLRENYERLESWSQILLDYVLTIV